MIKRSTVYDLRVRYKPTRLRFGLELDESGSLMLATGKEKLARQLARTVVNEPIRSSLVKARTDMEIETLVTGALDRFRTGQVNFTRNNIRNLVGWALFEQRSDGSYIRIDEGPIQETFVHRNQDNAIPNAYAIKAVFNDGTIRSGADDTFIAIPSGLTKNQKWIIRSRVAVLPESKRVKFYMLTNRKFDKDELLEKIRGVKISRGTDPRQVTIKIDVQTLAGSSVSAAPTVNLLGV